MTDLGTTTPVGTHAIQAALSLQLLEQGKMGIDAILIPEMIAAVDRSIQASIINNDISAITITNNETQRRLTPRGAADLARRLFARARRSA